MTPKKALAIAIDNGKFVRDSREKQDEDATLAENLVYDQWFVDHFCTRIFDAIVSGTRWIILDDHRQADACG